MKRVCDEPDCNQTYDDEFQLTLCPHNFFQMRTVVSHSRYGFLGIATSVTQLRQMYADAERRAREEGYRQRSRSLL